jgi:hypothetical protein
MRNRELVLGMDENEDERRPDGLSSYDPHGPQRSV